MGLGRARNASPARVSRWRPRHCELFLLYEIVSAIPSLREDQLNEKVRNTEEFQAADAAGKLIWIATGDGMALALFSSPDAPVRCALQLAEAVRQSPRLH